MATESILNRKALRDFHILDRYEAGIELKGSEVKSIRAGKANINDAFARIEKGQAFLFNADIQPYEKASHEIPAAKRTRKLLLHRPRPRRAQALLEEWKTESRTRGRPGKSGARQAPRSEKTRSRTGDAARSRPFQSQASLISPFAPFIQCWTLAVRR
jgi:hypothetical protein